MAPELENKGGAYCEDCAVSVASELNFKANSLATEYSFQQVYINMLELESEKNILNNQQDWLLSIWIEDLCYNIWTKNAKPILIGCKSDKITEHNSENVCTQTSV